MKRVFIGKKGIRAGWRALLFLTVFAAVLAAFAAVVLSFGRGGLLHAPLALRLPLQEIVSVLATAVATAVLARIERRSPWSYGLRDPAALRRFAHGLLIGILCLGAELAVLAASGHQSIEPGGTNPAVVAAYGLAWFALFFLVAFFEETFFRGYLLVTLASGIRFWPAAGISALIFGAGHIANSGEGAIGAAAAGAFGLVLTLALLRSGSLWFPIGIHAGWDWGESWLFGTADSGLRLPGTLFASHPRGAAPISGGTAGPEGSIVVFAVLLVMAAIVMRSYHGDGVSIEKQAA